MFSLNGSQFGNLRYGGVELVVSELVRGLDEVGEKIYLFAPKTSSLDHGIHIPTLESHTWVEKNGQRKVGSKPEELEAHYEKSLDHLLSNPVDIIQNHIFLPDSKSYDLVKDKLDIPILTTIHGPVNQSMPQRYETWKKLQDEGYPVYFNALTQTHKDMVEFQTGIRVDDVVNNSVPLELYDYNSVGGNYLFWIGRINESKGPDLAARISKKAGIPLVIAGEVQSSERDFYHNNLEPHLTKISKAESNFLSSDEPLDVDLLDEEIVDFTRQLDVNKNPLSDGDVYFIGPVNTEQKNKLFGHALATLMPNRWEEPFGLVIPESYATGTPIIGSKKGSLQELISPGKTGALVDAMTEEQMVAGFIESLEDVHSLNRYDCRLEAEDKYSRQSMVANYQELYASILNGGYGR
jgi:glycosyltransferase involved in cell wall biosynthesis